VLIPIVLLIICILSIIIDLILISCIVQAITKKDSVTVKKSCNKLLLAIICGAVTLSIYTVLDVLKTGPSVSLWLITLKLLNCIGPFIIGEGAALYMFRKAAKKIE